MKYKALLSASAFLFLFGINYANELVQENEIKELNSTEPESLKAKSFLERKIRNFLGESSFLLNKNFIKSIFKKEEDFYNDGKIDNKKVLSSLKRNGLLNLRFDKPREVNITFNSKTNPIFLILSINSTLQTIGYSYFEIKNASQLDGITRIEISLLSEYMIDPLVIIEELNKRGYIFEDINRPNQESFEYDLRLFDSRLPNARAINIGDSLNLRDVNGEYWLSIRENSKMSIRSNSPKWHPKIVFFDKDLKIIDVLKREDVLSQISFLIPNGVRFLLISDLNNTSTLRNGIKINYE
ncbi:MAG: hypothetical protein E7K04_05325 [Helicobacter sp.]|nr:hypothetical protein [Helicobacter sp.]